MKQFTSQIKRSKVLLCMLIPALAYVILFCYIPMTGVSLAFKNFKYALGIFKSPWCGWDNFRYLFVTGKIWSRQEIHFCTILHLSFWGFFSKSVLQFY